MGRSEEEGGGREAPAGCVPKAPPGTASHRTTLLLRLCDKRRVPCRTALRHTPTQPCRRPHAADDAATMVPAGAVPFLLTPQVNGLEPRWHPARTRTQGIGRRIGAPWKWRRKEAPCLP